MKKVAACSLVFLFSFQPYPALAQDIPNIEGIGLAQSRFDGAERSGAASGGSATLTPIQLFEDGTALMEERTESLGRTRHDPWCRCGVDWHGGEVRESHRITRRYRIVNPELYSQTRAEEAARGAGDGAAARVGLLSGLGVGAASFGVTAGGLHLLRRGRFGAMPAAVPWVVGGAVALAAGIGSGVHFGDRAYQRSYGEAYEPAYRRARQKADLEPEWDSASTVGPRVVETFDNRAPADSPCHSSYTRQPGQTPVFSGDCRPTVSLSFDSGAVPGSLSAVVRMESDLFTAVERMRGYAALTFSVGDAWGQEWTSLSGLSESSMIAAVGSFHLSEAAVCPRPSSQPYRRYLKAAVSVKDRFTGGRLSGFADYEAHAEYLCPATQPASPPAPSRWLGVQYGFSSDGIQVSASVRIVNEGEFYRMRADGGYVELRFYAGDRSGQERRLLSNRSFSMTTPRASFTFPLNSVCNRASYESYERFLKVRAFPRDVNGRADAHYGEFKGARMRVVCAGSEWENYEFLEELEESINID
ncbi:MAG: hypothetical protein HYT79_04765 [Elusimicrobia bacterium]|nr:hypothetical protein [Elusimicrobiota bacterium]